MNKYILKCQWEQIIDNLGPIVCDGCKARVILNNGVHYYSLGITGPCSAIAIKEYMENNKPQ